MNNAKYAAIECPRCAGEGHYDEQILPRYQDIEPRYKRVPCDMPGCHGGEVEIGTDILELIQELAEQESSEIRGLRQTIEAQRSQIVVMESLLTSLRRRIAELELSSERRAS